MGLEILGSHHTRTNQSNGYSTDASYIDSHLVFSRFESRCLPAKQDLDSVTLVERGTFSSATHGTFSSAIDAILASENHLMLAGAETAVYVSGTANTLAGAQGQIMAGSSSTFREFVADVTPVLGAFRAWGRMSKACGF
ncbi:MAG: hypothetical protein ACOC5M_01640 [Chloroflexota bacterium]